MVRAGEASDLSISHNGKKISGNVSAAQMAIWNAGKRPIRENDILSPIVISTGGGQPVLERHCGRSAHGSGKPAPSEHGVDMGNRHQGRAEEDEVVAVRRVLFEMADERRARGSLGVEKFAVRPARDTR